MTDREQVFSGLAPAAVWRHFASLCRIPRASGQEAALRAYLQQWGRELGLATAVDQAGNLLLRKPASPGLEGAPGVVLQAHLDMVCQKNRDSAHDFSRDAIVVHAREGWLYAPETTLGADNGIGVALMMAVLEDASLVHGPLEALFTVVEESGMDGARGLAPAWLQGRYLLNLDSEQWGEFTVGCAGGVDVNVQRPGQAQALPAGQAAYRIVLSGLRGGHSGMDIHRGRGNAIKLLVQLLQDLASRFPWRLAELHGGTARNALPREATAVVVMDSVHLPLLDETLHLWQTRFNQELQGGEEQVCLSRESSHAQALLSLQEQAIWLDCLQAAPHGVKSMSAAFPGVVETSNNLGIVALLPESGSCNFMVRSLRDAGAEALAAEIGAVFSRRGGQVEVSGQYPGWTPDPTSSLLAACCAVFAEEGGQQAVVQVIHAGLECGIIGSKYPGMDMISFGPTIQGAHAPGESVQVASVAQTWRLLLAILARLGQVIEPATA